MKNLATALVLTLGLNACAPIPMRTVAISAPFDEQQAQEMLKEGNNTVKGNAFLRQRGGGVVTCAGSEVNLIPATAYAKERITALYGGDEGLRMARRNVRFDPDVPAYRKLLKTATCDARGDFEFENVADGEFYVQTKVSWEVGSSIFPEGASILQKVSLSGGKVEKIIMGR
jgi:putative lipoprotein